MPFLGGSKILGEAGKQEIKQQIFRTDIFQKLSLGAPVIMRWVNVKSKLPTKS